MIGQLENSDIYGDIAAREEVGAEKPDRKKLV